MSTAASANNSPSVRHLLYLDGLRGLAALYVVFHHAYMEVVSEQTPVHLPRLVKFWTNWLGYGQVAVDVFIVLSGYCLMMPVARAESDLRGGIIPYLRRRARRIIPPYYAAMALSLLLIAIVPGMNRSQGYRWDVALPAFQPGVLLSHLLLVHNLQGLWLHAIDPPMWSVATEWQIYFFFPLLLLPCWRKFGNVATVGLAFAVGLAPHFLGRFLDFACPWFLGLFALGMTAAAISVRRLLRPEVLITWSARLGLLAFAVFLGPTVMQTQWLRERLYLSDTLVGFATACLLVFCTGHYESGKKSTPFLLKIMQTRFAILLGTFSYSLYLIHFPLLSWLHLGLRSRHWSASVTLLFLSTIGVALSLLVSYGFHILFERRFMPGAPKNEKQAEVAAAHSPAP